MWNSSDKTAKGEEIKRKLQQEQTGKQTEHMSRWGIFE
jgi:hypothetical protein